MRDKCMGMAVRLKWTEGGVMLCNFLSNLSRNGWRCIVAVAEVRCTLRNASSATYNDLCRDNPGGLVRTSSRLDDSKEVRNVAKSRTEFYFVQCCAQQKCCETSRRGNMLHRAILQQLAVVAEELTAIHLSLIFRFFKCLLFRLRIGYTALKLSCVTNFGMLFLMMGFICLFHESWCGCVKHREDLLSWRFER